MTPRKKTKYVHEGRYVAEVDVGVIEDETDWSPCLSLEDLQTASAYGRIYEMHPVEESK